MLSDEDLGSLYDLLIDDAPQIRHAVGDLVYDHLICPASEGSAFLPDLLKSVIMYAWSLWNTIVLALSFVDK